MTGAEALQAHLEGGLTTVCRCWAVTRRDGAVLGFTDHDSTLVFGGVKYLANTGLTARAFEQTTGLSVDNSEAVGALSDPAIRDADVEDGLFDGAAVEAWLVNWADTDMRRMMFKGSFGEIERAGPNFRVDLRGLSDVLNQPQGRIYQRSCAAVLGDGKCKVDLSTFEVEGNIASNRDGLVLRVDVEGAFEDGWFAKGLLKAGGRTALIKSDHSQGARRITLWQSMAGLDEGTPVTLTAGCDKRLDTCREKFSNVLNFRGFPDIPGEDWLMSYPVQSGLNDGGSLSK